MFVFYIGEASANNQTENFKISESTYRNTFSSKFNLSISHQRSDTCGTCEKGDVDVTHVGNCHQLFEMQKFDWELPKQKSEVAYLTVDSVQTMPLPILSVTKAFISDKYGSIISMCTSLPSRRMFLTSSHELRMLPVWEEIRCLGLF
ncbi:hypothetical protein AVEN_63235-1 [Araneus ventricosus]|uniref:Uncharacterized protein n=1 Tax=Araneus ventricosus TaxID=182803 RepID=A0A4Y2B4D7_ARAVE|nr:hypothetical protein AVEN_63235-1 [Araneus ventricosus]